MANWYNCPTPIEARIARVSALYQARLARVSLMAHPGFQYKVNQEGYSNYTFGGRVGTSFEFSALCHDLAHAVEFGPDLFTERCSPSSGFVRSEEHTSELTTLMCLSYAVFCFTKNKN